MPAVGWYVRRLRTMSGKEIVWRGASALRGAGLWSRVVLGREPAPSTACRTAGTSHLSPPFRVSPLEVGAWKSPATAEVRAWRERLLNRADRIADHRLSFFDLQDRYLGHPIDWNRDHGSGVRAPLRFSPLIDYREARTAGDAKVVWEPNRHHHLVVLARAYRASADPRYAAAIVEQLESWLDQCPFGYGMNWRSPLELAIRLINWVWAIDLVHESGVVAADFWHRVQRSAYQHLWQITRSYSRGSSANNHRIGEAAGVFIATSYLPGLDPRGRWRRESWRILADEILTQTHTDGGTREQAVGYHLFVLQFFALAGVVARRTAADFPAEYWARLERMVEFLAVLGEGGRSLPMLGDADDGYVLDLGSPGDPGETLALAAAVCGRTDLAAAEPPEAVHWLLGNAGWNLSGEAAVSAPRRLESRALPESGYYLLQCGTVADGISVVFDCGELGFGPLAAHGHADALSFTLRVRGHDVLVDPGTYDYFSFPAWRQYFRSTRAHNTVAVDDQDQSVMLGPFLWGARAQARCLAWAPAGEGGRVAGEHDGYRRLADPVVHRRTLDLDARTRVLVVRDDILARGSHAIAIHFHLAEDVAISAVGPNRFRLTVGSTTATLELDANLTAETLAGSEDPIGGWVSRGYHRRTPATTLIARGQSRGASTFTTRITVAP